MNQNYYDQERKISSCERLGITLNQWAYIKRIGSTLNGLYCNDCNGFELDRERIKNEKKEEILEKNARKFAADNGLFIFLQGDPRGATIYLDKQEIPENNYTRAVCVY